MSKWEKLIIGACVFFSLGFVAQIINPEDTRQLYAAQATAKSSPLHSRRCEEAIEESAKYNFRWTSWSGRLKLTEIPRQLDPADQMYRFVGNSAEAQNGLGNWLPVHYSCEITKSSLGIVLRVEIEAGRRL